MPSNQWYSPNKETFIRPKDEGLGIMISAFQSTELTASPFLREFESGQNADGCWTYQHMVLQLEDDCVNVLNVKYPQYDFLFLFDHSCGHDRQREDVLNVEKMSSSYGGQAQRKMRETKI